MYDPNLVNLTDDQHSDAKEIDDLINALVDKNGNAAQEALDAVMALVPDLASTDRFLHLFKVMTGVMSNQLQQRVINKPVTPDA